MHDTFVMWTCIYDVVIGYSRVMFELQQSSSVYVYYIRIQIAKMSYRALLIWYIPMEVYARDQPHGRLYEK